MARTKQATPLRRDPSSEYFRRDTAGSPSRSPGSWDKEMSNGESNGHANGSAAKGSAAAQNEAGAMQLLVAVGGIYASLYAPSPFWSTVLMIHPAVSPGPSCKST